ncbi:uncharacterized protein B0T23DRAFT_439785 [Neurospora hispaniola]|uniref:Uncharacterized protein n=1 Tax=Neurospora hispaniola TaxID=588809 RepID=A0AAJ0I9D1_9PEZI|nr:hypothetical protein B0T23DRAFT_439785 [Neurospora hispaniola]
MKSHQRIVQAQCMSLQWSGHGGEKTHRMAEPANNPHRGSKPFKSRTHKRGPSRLLRRPRLLRPRGLLDNASPATFRTAPPLAAPLPPSMRFSAKQRLMAPDSLGMRATSAGTRNNFTEPSDAEKYREAQPLDNKDGGWRGCQLRFGWPPGDWKLCGAAPGQAGYRIPTVRQCGWLFTQLGMRKRGDLR